MNSKLLNKILETIEADVRSRPSPLEYELAYQARIAIDRIRFAISQTEQFARHSDQAREANLQLLDALDRLEGADRRFQTRFHSSGALPGSYGATNGPPAGREIKPAAASD